jgi:intracellular sulfur oxidation DsrE/DsrF family protein
MRFRLLLLASALATPWLTAAPPAELEYPLIKDHGGVFRIAGKPELPRGDSKVVVDVTAGDEEGGVNKGFARAARFVNLFALGGVKDFQMAIVLHGAATKEALSDEAYSRLFGKANPNRALIRQLRDAGVQILVCGQALNHAGYDPSQAAPEIDVALSAATAVINRQMQGYGFLPIE